MSYLRLDNQFETHSGWGWPALIQPVQYVTAAAQPTPKLRPQPQSRHQLRPQSQAGELSKISGIYALMKCIGYPDITDSLGDIAIWASTTLRSRGYKFLHRVEIINESVPSLYPVKHFSNIYIWVKIHLTDTMLNNINQISTDIFYDRGKELLIVRSDTLDTAVAQASLIGLYSKGQIKYYDIMNNNMLKNYYLGVKKPKIRKALYNVLDNLAGRSGRSGRIKRPKR
jgi:hypothetical protein